MKAYGFLVMIPLVLAGCADTANIAVAPAPVPGHANMAVAPPHVSGLTGKKRTTLLAGNNKMGGKKMGGKMSTEAVSKSDEEWRKSLTPEQYNILRDKGTERAFTGKFWNNHDTGMYTCAACGLELFSSAAKFDSGTGWPSFWDAVGKDRIRLKEDNTYAMARTEVECARCGGHLGHLFDDGPNPTGQRYCINSASLEFKKK